MPLLRLETMRARIEWMDALRGTAIVLVILYHGTLNVQETYDAAPEWLVLINAPLTAVRMPR